MCKNKYVKIGPLCDDQNKCGSSQYNSDLSDCMGLLHSFFCESLIAEAPGRVPK